MNILVTGGAGYIGSHTVQELERCGHRVVVVDNLAMGHRSAVSSKLVAADVGDRQAIGRLLRDERIDGVIHFAAFAAAGESVENPGKYFRNNVCATQALLDTMVEAGVRRLVFSSSCAVYGQPDRLPVTEEAPTRPESPYGESKLMVEQMLPWYDRAHGLKSVSLRYFNVAGAALDASLGDDVRPATRLIPVALEVVLGKRPHLKLFGTDYPTPDGTCIRDYIHVVDLAVAHILALDHLEQKGTSDIFNVGIGRGYSNREVIEAAKRITDVDFPVVELPRRLGDPACIYADSGKIRQTLGWEPRHSDLETMIRTSWEWRRNHAEGYSD